MSDHPVKGWVHAWESCGMVDGPGLRFVLFLQGCPLRCLYCHNPDSWAFRRGSPTDARQVVEEAASYRSWMDSSGGGLTLSGGEPLAQPEFSLDILRRARRQGIHTALDTSGFGPPEKIRPCLDEADLVILDVKTPRADKHRALTGVDARTPLATLEYLKAREKPLWVRHVLVPGLTDGPEELRLLASMLRDIPSLERFELLPFHQMGEVKWKREGLSYSLGAVSPPDAEALERAKEIFRRTGLPSGE